MKQEKGLYIFAFLCGVLMISVSGDAIWNTSVLSRYYLVTLSFDGINFEEYFVQILFLRLRTAIGLWVLARILSEKIVSIGFAFLMYIMLGGIVAMVVLQNGIWGVLFLAFALLPHSVFYIAAFILWRKNKMTVMQSRTESYAISILIWIVLFVGCILEAYISPNLIENIIKY